MQAQRELVTSICTCQASNRSADHEYSGTALRAAEQAHADPVTPAEHVLCRSVAVLTLAWMLASWSCSVEHVAENIYALHHCVLLRGS